MGTQVRLEDGWGVDTPVGDTPAPLFPFPEVQPWLPGAIADERILADDRTRLWVGYVEHRPVVIGSLFVEAGIGHLSLGVTLPEARGHGYRAAMARRRLAALPGLPAAGVFSDLSRPGAEARGCLPIVRFTLYVEPVRIRVLGSLQLGGDRDPLRSRRPRRLLAVLLVHHGTVVSVDRLPQLLWEDGQPAEPTVALQNLVWRLRAVRAAGCEGAAQVLTRAQGYLLDVDVARAGRRRTVRAVGAYRRVPAP